MKTFYLTGNKKCENEQNFWTENKANGRKAIFREVERSSAWVYGFAKSMRNVSTILQISILIRNVGECLFSKSHGLNANFN